jgi:hypothetical protein
MMERVDIVVIGAGAAGLMAAIWAGRTQSGDRIVALDGARKLGAKILISGGGRCNVTHERVEAADFAGSTRPAIAKVLRRFDVAQTVAFFGDMGVTLKREESGKLFPTTDSARTVLEALLIAARQAGVSLADPCRVTRLLPEGEGYRVGGDWGDLWARRVILATGGKSLPKSGSDGGGYRLAQSLGHSLTPHLLPALVPLTLPRGHFLCALSGISSPATLELWSATGKRIRAFTDSVLCTHFGLSGPAVLDMSRYYLEVCRQDPGTKLTINWLPDLSSEAFDRELQRLGRTGPLPYLRQRLPNRLAAALVANARAGEASLTRTQRLALVSQVTRNELPVVGHRGFNYAEATAGGVPLRELKLDRMESRLSPDLFLCGEICDVDGRIGGFNFQWAWASGYVAGVAAGQAIAGRRLPKPIATSKAWASCSTPKSS